MLGCSAVECLSSEGWVSDDQFYALYEDEGYNGREYVAGMLMKRGGRNASEVRQ